MKPIFLLITALVAIAVLTGSAVAQTADNQTESELIEELQGDDCAEPEAIDENTVLCSSTLDDGTATLVLKSDKLQRIMLTDSGAFMRGGEVPRQRYTLRADEVNTVRMGVVSHNGYSGVAITTEQVLWSVPLEEQSTLIGGPWNHADAQIAALFAGLSTSIVSAIFVLRAVLGRSTKPERIA